MSAATCWIVLAKVEVELEYAGAPHRRDLGELPRVREVSVPRALVWKRRGGETDLAKATAYANREGYRVYTYPDEERWPLERARADATTP